MEQQNSLIKIFCCYAHDDEDLLKELKKHASPLHPQQIDDALTNNGINLDVVLTAIHSDSDLQELVRSPFILGILITMARDGTRLSRALLLGTGRKQILDQYIQNVLSRRGQATQYKPAQTLSWLTWIARELDRSHQTVFYLDRLQFDCLPQKQSRFLSRVIVLSFKLIIGLSTAVAGIRSFESIGGFGSGLIGIAFGLIGAIYLAKSELVKGDIEPVEKVRWSWVGVKQHLFGSLSGLILLCVGSILSLFFAFPPLTIFGLDIPFFSVIRDGMPITLSSGLLGLLLIVQSGWTSEHFGESLNRLHLRRPNQGIWRSGRHGLIVGLIFGGVSSLAFSFIHSSLISGLLFGWFVGLAMGLLNGGMVCIKHVLLRLCLWQAGSIPWHYSHFLDDAAERMLLYKVGGDTYFCIRYFRNTL